MSSSTYDDTSGSAVREPHSVMDRLMTFDLGHEIAQLRDEPQYRDGDRTSRTLAKDVDLRVLLTVLRSGARLDEQDGDARVSVQVLEGTVAVELDGASSDLSAGQLAVLDRGNPWLLTAREDSALLLTVAWPPERAGV